MHLLIRIYITSWQRRKPQNSITRFHPLLISVRFVKDTTCRYWEQVKDPFGNQNLYNSKTDIMRKWGKPCCVFKHPRSENTQSFDIKYHKILDVISYGTQKFHAKLHVNLSCFSGSFNGNFIWQSVEKFSVKFHMRVFCDVSHCWKYAMRLYVKLFE